MGVWVRLPPQLPNDTVAEWLKAAVCKTVWGNPHVGSNPTSATNLDSENYVPLAQLVRATDS